MSSSSDDRFEEALAIHAGIFDQESADQIARGLERGYPTAAMGDFVRLTLSHGMVDMWSRPGLDLRTRSVVQIASLTAMREWSPLASHIRLGLKNGLTPDEIMEILLQLSVYGGQAMGNTAFGVAFRILKEAQAERGSDSASSDATEGADSA